MALSISYQQTEDILVKFKGDFDRNDIPYIILKAFGKHDADVRRWKEGKGIISSYDGLLIKGLMAYKSCSSMQMDTVLESMKKDPVVKKAAVKIIAVSDGQRILAFNPKDVETFDNALNQLWVNFQFFYPLAGVEKYRGTEENPADIKAAEKMAKLHDEIRAYNDYSSTADLHDLNIFMSRLLFCFFAEDTGIFSERLFSSSIERYTKVDGSDTAEYIEAAFAIMNKEINERQEVVDIITQFPYVNGSLFSKFIEIPRMGQKARRLLIECGSLNWKDINPDIFGSMIQAVVSPTQRGNLGMHYTSVPNIMKVIQPLFLDDLYQAYADSKDSVKKLQQLLVRMSKMRFFDPACGSGNFLIIAYKELRKLEIQIWKRIGEVSGTRQLPFVYISIDQFYGIEIDDFACEIAELSLRLAQHQMNCVFTREFAEVSIPALPLEKVEHIFKGNACRLDWNTVCPHTAEDEVFLMGNPPYLGSRRQDSEQKRDMEFVFRKNFGELDYIACWFYLGSIYIRNTKARCAFVSTNSICQGLQVALLWKRTLKDDIVINFAHTSFRWSNNAKYNATVTVIIVGLCNKDEANKRRLYKDNQMSIVDNISPLLIDAPTIFVESRTKPINEGWPIMNFGNMPADGGQLILSDEDRNDILQEYPDADKFIKPLLGAEEFINGKHRWCIWLHKAQQKDYRHIKPFMDRIENLREIRMNSSRPQLASTPHLFAQITQPMDSEVILIPCVSSENRRYIPMGIFTHGEIVANSCMVLGTDSLFLFGVLTSYMHMLWMKAVGGKLETRYRYSAQVVYNTFPFPKVSVSRRQEIEKAAEDILLCREDYPHATMSSLYDSETMPTELLKAHNNLDLIVEQCYREAEFANDEERLECLFRLYEKMTKKK